MNLLVFIKVKSYMLVKMVILDLPLVMMTIELRVIPHFAHAIQALLTLSLFYICY